MGEELSKQFFELSPRMILKANYTPILDNTPHFFAYGSGSIGATTLADSANTARGLVCKLIDTETDHSVVLHEDEIKQFLQHIIRDFEFGQAEKDAGDLLAKTVKEAQRDVAQEKGWDLVKDLLKPEEFDALQRNEWVVLKGSDGATWGVRMDGQVTREGSTLRGIQTVKGRITGADYSGFVFPDKLAAVIQLIKENAAVLVKKWGCGNLTTTGGDLVV